MAFSAELLLSCQSPFWKIKSYPWHPCRETNRLLFQMTSTLAKLLSCSWNLSRAHVRVCCHIPFLHSAWSEDIVRAWYQMFVLWQLLGLCSPIACTSLLIPFNAKSWMSEWLLCEWIIRQFVFSSTWLGVFSLTFDLKTFWKFIEVCYAPKSPSQH